jgi:hypothetical protein
VKYTLTNGNVLLIKPNNNAKGKKLLKKLRGKRVVVSCGGIDSLNTTYISYADKIKWPKKASKLKVKLRSALVPEACGVGLSYFTQVVAFFPAVDASTEGLSSAPDAYYQVQFTQMERVIEMGLAFRYVSDDDDLTSQELVNLINEMTSYEPPYPLLALSSATEYLAPEQLGLWNTFSVLRVHLTNVDDSEPLSYVIEFSGISRV